MWRENALKRLEQGSGTLTFKTQREINEEREEKLKQMQVSWSRLQENNIKFYEAGPNKAY